MIALTIQDIDEELEGRLRRRAARHGRSLQEEARLALVEHVADETPAAAPRDSAWDVIRRLRDKAGGGADFEPLDRSEWQDRPVDFGS
ncbi:hypothetical protein GCM10011390_46930 [Aureimonas endophytica]|uniref:Antitoxin FitA-like ribbon-helix-helix domain-containing protein n=1 Tax=Aureimonas endophytica TaxID=2027858 RepID=A0A917A1G2_9HYPH|nr:plasmid stabilization protein [Aureimonas endophytica]GGE22177.1 hypothetical protein GCM10011390_46930 [Aureimonas endophytica]